MILKLKIAAYYYPSWTSPSVMIRLKTVAALDKGVLSLQSSCILLWNITIFVSFLLGSACGNLYSWRQGLWVWCFTPSLFPINGIKYMSVTCKKCILGVTGMDECFIFLLGPCYACTCMIAGYPWQFPFFTWTCLCIQVNHQLISPLCDSHQIFGSSRPSHMTTLTLFHCPIKQEISMFKAIR